jgi:hypothetical protein
MGSRVGNAAGCVSRGGDGYAGRPTVAEPRLIERGFASADPAAPPRRMPVKRAFYFERYELSIGDWKTTVLKTLDCIDGSVRFKAEPGADSLPGA